MSDRLKYLVASWFIVQIVLPFTSPLHACDLRDLLGAINHEAPASPTTPVPVSETESDANLFVSPLAASLLSASEPPAADCAIAMDRPFAFDVTSSPQVQQTALRL